MPLKVPAGKSLPIFPEPSIPLREKPQEETSLQRPPDGNKATLHKGSNSAVPPVETIYDPDGDLELIVGMDPPHHFRLSAKRLKSTSHVWQDVVTVSHEDIPKKVQLADDDPESMSILLNIVHLRFSELPRYLIFEKLISLARLSHKYKSHELFQPFVAKWIDPFIRKELYQDRPEWILIAWEFSLRAIFEHWLEYLCRECEKDEDGELVLRGRKLAELVPEAHEGKYGKAISGFLTPSRIPK
jgi:hypothetical protein